MRNRKRWCVIAVTVGFAGVSAVAYRVLDERRRYRVAPTEPPILTFDHAGWSSGSATLRHGMARRLTADNELVGQSRDEVVAKLGPQTQADDTGKLTWRLGPRQSPDPWFWDYQGYLAVYFDDRGICTKATIIEVD